ncbi:low temperature requirement protein A [Novosphingobium sp.]|uniref:low temperature requirement protein A n=1 Tax=Novosphingobium sp. TaxID=1874826 RepID=UPI003B51AA22
MPRGLLRSRSDDDSEVSNLELFFDLVYVFAITQIAAFVREHLSLPGVIEGALLFMAVWWAWMFTAWATNWANPDTVRVRLMMIVTMLASLVLAAVLPRAFDGHTAALVFVAMYCTIQIGRTLFLRWIMATERPSGARNMMRIAIWFTASVPLWLAGAMADSQAWHIALWAGALVIEYAGPFAFFRVPGLGRSTSEDWDISGSHLAERASQFVLIAMGEGIVVTGAAFAGAVPTQASTGAFLASFVGSVLMWWIYFDIGAERGAEHISHSDDVGRIARNAYTYLHIPIVASVVAGAVADALLMASPGVTASRALIIAGGGGLVGFLLGLALFKRFSSARGNLPLSHLVGQLLLAPVIVVACFGHWSATKFTALCDGALFVVALWEWGSYHGGWLERFDRWGVPFPIKPKPAE